VVAIERAMERDPSRRWSSAREMATALRAGAPTTIAGAADSTMVSPIPGPTAGAVTPSPTPTLVGATAPPVATPARPARRPRTVAWLLIPLGVLLIVLVAAFLASRDGGGVPTALGGEGVDNTAGDVALAADLRDVADRIEVGDGARGSEAAGRLREIAAVVAEGGDAGEQATALLRDAVSWNNDGRQLLDTATDLTVEVLSRVPGVDVDGARAAATPPQPVVADGGGDDEGRGRAKGKNKGDDDD
jgi:hypothetical protein